jgi:hypothetical protein
VRPDTILRAYTMAVDDMRFMEALSGLAKASRVKFPVAVTVNMATDTAKRERQATRFYTWMLKRMEAAK